MLIPASFGLFSYHNSKYKLTTVDIVLGIQTRDQSIVGADGSTELWGRYLPKQFYIISKDLKFLLDSISGIRHKFQHPRTLKSFFYFKCNFVCLQICTSFIISFLLCVSHFSFVFNFSMPTFLTVRPDLAKFRHFGIFVTVYFLIGKILLWQICEIIWANFQFCNGPNIEK